MALRKITFTVSGRGSFPLDMLRYDASWPLNGIDVDQIRSSIDAEFTKRYEVTLMSHSMPTEDRWESFGFDVKVQ